MTTKFEAAIYNDHVLAALKEGEHHKDLDDEWANTHYFEVSANTIEEAWAKTKRKYREEHGYVIKAIEITD